MPSVRTVINQMSCCRLIVKRCAMCVTARKEMARCGWLQRNQNWTLEQYSRVLRKTNSGTGLAGRESEAKSVRGEICEPGGAGPVLRQSKDHHFWSLHRLRIPSLSESSSLLFSSDFNSYQLKHYSTPCNFNAMFCNGRCYSLPFGQWQVVDHEAASDRGTT